MATADPHPPDRQHIGRFTGDTTNHDSSALWFLNLLRLLGPATDVETDEGFVTVDDHPADSATGESGASVLEGPSGEGVMIGAILPKRAAR